MSRHNRERRRKTRAEVDLDAIPQEKPVILGCQPATPAGQLKWIVSTGDDSGGYSDSVKGVCEKCKQEVWIGPRQQEVLARLQERNRPVAVWCLNCAAADQSGAAIGHLGNPEKGC